LLKYTTNAKGITSAEDIELAYAPKIITQDDFQHNILLISIKPSYDKINKPVALYESTRKSWNVSMEKVKFIGYVIATYQGILKEIYKAHEWKAHEWKAHQLDKNSPVYKENQRTRYEFSGDVGEDKNIRELYLNKKLNEQVFFGNPIRYVINKDITTESE
jgi:hypothetical protein